MEYQEQGKPDIAHQPVTITARKMTPQYRPDIDGIQKAVLMDGPRVQKIAKHVSIRNRHTGKIHHDALTLLTYRKSRNGLALVKDKSVSLSGEQPDEIQALMDFLHIVRDNAIPNESGDYVVVPAPTGPDQLEALNSILATVSKTGEYGLLANVLSNAGQNPELFKVLLERATRDPQLFAEAAAAINLARYSSAVEELSRLIESTADVHEHDFQTLLAEHPWMFGSEYSELLDRRRWTRDEQHDFVLRRTTDGYIELIEIKTPLNGATLFQYDQSHKSYYPGVALSKVIGQVQLYIEKLDSRRDAIKVDDHEDTLKIRAKVIIGRNGEPDQIQALRRFNGHLHRIEIITFDQLLNIAERVLGYLNAVLLPNDKSS